MVTILYGIIVILCAYIIFDLCKQIGKTKAAYLSVVLAAISLVSIIIEIIKMIF